MGNNYNVELAVNYQSKSSLGTINLSPQYGVDIGASKSLLDKSIIIKAGLNDIFNTRKQTFTSASPLLEYTSRQKIESRFFMFSLIFKFSKGSVKSNATRESSSQEEKIE